MGYGRVSGASDSSRRLPETTQEVFPCRRSCKPAAHKLAKSLNILIPRAGAYRSILATSPIKKWVSPNVGWYPGGSFELSS